MPEVTLIGLVGAAVGQTYAAYPLTTEQVMELEAVVPENDDPIQLIKTLLTTPS